MQISVKLDRSELIIGEDTGGVVILRNTTGNLVAVTDPQTSGEGWGLRVTDKSTNTFQDFDIGAQSRRYDPHDVPTMLEPSEQTVAPRQTLELPFRLLPWIGTQTAGQYQLQAMYQWQGVSALSEALDYSIVAAENHWVNTQPPTSDLDASWFQARIASAEGQPPALLIHAVQYRSYARPVSTINVGPISAGAQPSVSVAPNGDFSDGQWIAWLDGEALKYAYADSEELAITREVNSFALGNNKVQMLRPLLAAIPNDEPPGFGYALLLQPQAGAGEGRLLAVTLAPSGAAKGIALAKVPAGQPLWSHVAFLSSDVARATWITQSGEEFRLHVVSWPVGAAPTSVSIKAPATYTGRWVGAAAGLAGDDTLHGGVVVWDGNNVSIRRWAVDANGNYTPGADLRIADWPADADITDSRIRVNREGQVFGLLRDAEAHWHLFDSEGALTAMPLVPDAAESIDLAFYRKIHPVARYYFPAVGFQYVLPGGERFPVW